MEKVFNNVLMVKTDNFTQYFIENFSKVKDIKEIFCFYEKNRTITKYNINKVNDNFYKKTMDDRYNYYLFVYENNVFELDCLNLKNNQDILDKFNNSSIECNELILDVSDQCSLYFNINYEKYSLHTIEKELLHKEMDCFVLLRNNEERIIFKLQEKELLLSLIKDNNKTINNFYKLSKLNRDSLFNDENIKLLDTVLNGVLDPVYESENFVIIKQCPLKIRDDLNDYLGLKNLIIINKQTNNQMRFFDIETIKREFDTKDIIVFEKIFKHCRRSINKYDSVFQHPNNDEVVFEDKYHIETRVICSDDDDEFTYEVINYFKKDNGLYFKLHPKSDFKEIKTINQKHEILEKFLKN